jgi:lysozyme family protein
MQSDFNGALAFVLQAEGGYSDDPDDPGGATNKGIEQTEYDVWRKRKGEAAQDVRLITEEEAAAIYKANYWDAVHGDYIASALAYALFDTAVNLGCSGAIRDLQDELGVASTGIFDSATSASYQEYINKAHSPLALAGNVLDRRVAAYHRIAANSPKLAKFLDGWLNRVTRLRRVISNLD